MIILFLSIFESSLVTVSDIYIGYRSIQIVLTGMIVIFILNI